MKTYDLEKLNLRLAKQYVREIEPSELKELINDDFIDWSADIFLSGVVDDYIYTAKTPIELKDFYKNNFSYYGLSALYYDGDSYYRVTQI